VLRVSAEPVLFNVQHPIAGRLHANRNADHSQRQDDVETEMKADGKRDLTCDQSCSKAKNPSQRKMASGFSFETRVGLKVGCPKTGL
jgi:hypothetical protein